jgi:filamentous hemagglutinin
MGKRQFTWYRKFFLWLMVVNMISNPTVTLAKTRLSGYAAGRSRTVSAPAVNALPELNTDIHTGSIVDGVSTIDTTQDDASGTMDIYQEQTNIVINWDSFDVGENSTVTFHQESTNWSALNRIWDANPSAIFGQIDATGRIFLINQNGMIFGPDSTVNAHTLVATALNMTDDTFLSGSWKHGTIYLGGVGDDDSDDDPDDPDREEVVDEDNYQDMEGWDALAAEIRNEGYLQADTGGAIFLVGPRVSNGSGGVIDAEAGQAALVAAQAVELYHATGDTASSETSLERKIYVTQEADGSAQADSAGSIPAAGQVINESGGTVSAAYGIAGMYGSVVNQEGVIRSVTAVQTNGRIELRASETITTGEESRTVIDISEDTDETSTTAATPSKIVLGGLQTGSDSDTDLPDEIHHRGTIAAPAATVTITARDLVRLHAGSTIDVSGLWTERSAEANELEVQLNSSELADFFAVREGALYGETIYVNALKGCDIAYIDGYLATRALTAAEQFTTGGSVTIKAGGVNDADGNYVGGRVVVDTGAVVDFSGGGYHYTEGDVQLSYVRYGNQIFDVSEVPDRAVENGDQLTLISTSEAKRLGLETVETIAAYDEGHDAGSLAINAETISLKGTLDGSVTRGLYQTLAGEPGVTVGEITYQTAAGLAEPEAGSLLLGMDNTTEGIGYQLSDVVIYSDAEPPETEAEDVSYIRVESLNDAGLGRITINANNAIMIDAEADIEIAASHGSSGFTAHAQNIQVYGSITGAGADVLLAVKEMENVTVDSFRELDRRIYLGPQSVIDVSGQQVVKSALKRSDAAFLHPGYLDGGSVTLTADSNDGAVILDTGSSIDVSGGYAYDPDDAGVSGGDAGSLKLCAADIVVKGAIDGHSIVGYQGGSLYLWADEVAIVHSEKDTELPEEPGVLVLGDAWLTSTGMQDITIKSLGSLVIGGDVELTTSREKYQVVLPSAYLRGRKSPGLKLVTVDESLLAPSAITLASGEAFYGSEDVDAEIVVQEGAVISVIAGGSISLAAPDLTIAGTLSASGGDISLSAGLYGITVSGSAVIDASGTRLARQVWQNSRLVDLYSAQDGGTVTMEADSNTDGSIVIEAGARVDVSGAGLVTNTYYDSLGRATLTTGVGIGGTIELRAYDFEIDAGADQPVLVGQPGLTGYQGGELVLFSLATVQGDYLSVSSAQLEAYQAGGFDALELKSLVGIEFADDIDAQSGRFGRQLVLDAPKVVASAGVAAVYLSAPYMVLENSYEKYVEIGIGSEGYFVDSDDLRKASGAAALYLGYSDDSDWLDISGVVGLVGFSSVDMDVTYDVRLYDQPVVVINNGEADLDQAEWEGRLTTLGDITIRASRIYPDSDDTSFTISSGVLVETDVVVDGENTTLELWDGGDIAIEQSDTALADASIYSSAGGSLTLEGHTITVNGTLAAPMGHITINGYDRLVADEDGAPQLDDEGNSAIAAGEIQLLGEATLDVSGDVAVVYGQYDEDSDWTIETWIYNEDTGAWEYVETAVTEALERGVTLAAEIISTDPDSFIDVSGGGTIYSYAFQAGTDGSANPLTVAGRYVIVADQSVQLPGPAVYIEGNGTIASGTYTLLPESYAFLEGAIIIEDLGAVSSATPLASDNAGNAVVYGCTTTTGTGLRSSERHAYSVRAAEDVLSEGQFAGEYLVAGSGGIVSVSGGATILEGVLSGAGLDGYSGGVAKLSGSYIYVGDYDADAIFDLVLRPESLSGSGFESIELGVIDEDWDSVTEVVADGFYLLQDDDDDDAGDTGTTRKIVFDFAEGTVMELQSLGLYAEAIELQGNVSIQAEELLFETTADGQITIAEDTLLNVARMGIFTGSLDAGTTLGASDLLAIGALNPMSLIPEGFDARELSGHLVITENVWQGFSATATVALLAPEGINAFGQVVIQAGDASGGTLLLATSQINTHVYDDQDTATDDRQAVFQANRVYLLGAEEEPDSFVWAADEGAGSGTLAIEAFDTLYVSGGGQVRLTGIGSAELKSNGDTIFGTGTLSTNGADVVLTAARVTSTYSYDAEDGYQVGDFSIDAGEGKVRIQSSGGVAGDTMVPGGTLRISADTIENAGIIDLFAGYISLQAGEGGLYLEADSQLLARGGAIAYSLDDETVIDVNSGGLIALSSEGVFSAASGALIDVANSVGADLVAQADASDRAGWIADNQLDAGTIVISAPDAAVSLDADISGGSQWGAGGSFALDALSFDYNAVAAKIGDFDSLVQLRLRQGDMDVATAVRARRISLVADHGAILVGANADTDEAGNPLAILDASGDAGDRIIELYAQSHIILDDGAFLDAGATSETADGGEVILSSVDGWIVLGGAALDENGDPVLDDDDGRPHTIGTSSIDVSGGARADGGSVLFSAQRFTNTVLDASASADNDVRMALQAEITGAASVTAAGFRTEALSSGAAIDDDLLETAFDAAEDWVNAVGANGIAGSLSAGLTDADGNVIALQVRPGIEFSGEGDLTLAGGTLDLSEWRFGDDDVPGVLVIRAAGDLTIPSSIQDSPQVDDDNEALVYAADAADSWDITLVAGSDGGADPMSTTSGAGDLIFRGDGTQIYTESGTLKFAAGNDLVMKDRGGATPYLLSSNGTILGTGGLLFGLGTYDGRIEGVIGGDLNMGASSGYNDRNAIQSATGDIQVSVVGDVILGAGDALRTTGAPGALDLSDIAELVESEGDAVSSNVILFYALTTAESVAEFEEIAASYGLTVTVSQAMLDSYKNLGDNYEGWLSADRVTYSYFWNYVFPSILGYANTAYWDYSNGGDIALTAGGSVSVSHENAEEWMTLYGDQADPDHYAAVYANYTNTISNKTVYPATGVYTMAGGDVSVSAGGSIDKLPAATFGSGDLSLYARGDTDARVLVADGRGVVTAMGNFGTRYFDQLTAVELFDASMAVYAQGDVAVGTVLNPLLANKTLAGEVYVGYSEETSVALTAVTGDVSLAGDSYFHANPGLANGVNWLAEMLLPASVSLAAGNDILITAATLVLAPSADGQLTMVAGNDIRTDNYANGRLYYASIIMSDMAPEMVYASYDRPEAYQNISANKGYNIDSLLKNADFHGYLQTYGDAFLHMWDDLSETEQAQWEQTYQNVTSGFVLHQDDSQTVKLSAGRDIYGINLSVPKAADISAGRDIVDFMLRGQNINADDITSIVAGRDITLDYLSIIASESNTGFELAGPGWLVVSAGRSIDLGQTYGIQTIGSTNNSNLGSDGANIAIVAGYDLDADTVQGTTYTEQLETFFDELREAGIAYSALKDGETTNDDGDVVGVDIAWARALGEEFAALLENYDTYPDDDDPDSEDADVRNALASLLVEQTRSRVIDAFLQKVDWSDSAAGVAAVAPDLAGVDFEQALAAGSFSMVQSQVITTRGGDINIIAADHVDVGRSTFGSADSDSGIACQLSGDINIYSYGDINVNESRVITWYGGDITMWTDYGNINAGKGSTTASSSITSDYYYDEILEQWMVLRSIPVVGSGIRLLTNDPDGKAGPLGTAVAGAGYLFAPNGEIDASEAGIFGMGDLILGAETVVNAQNIESGGITLGAAAQNDTGAGIGNLSGISGLDATSSMSEEAAMMKTSQERFKEMVQAMNESLVPKWLAVEVTGFGEEEQPAGEGQDDDDQGDCSGLTGAALKKCIDQQSR